MSHPLDAILNPGSIAVIGASKDPSKRGHRAIASLLRDGYTGAVYPVHPTEDEVLGLRCLPDVAALPEAVDVALVCTPAATLPGVVEACGLRGIRGVVAVSGGFSEASEAGRALEERAVAIARRHGVRLVGPNMNGIFSRRFQCNLSPWRDVPVGRVAVLSNSANMGHWLLTRAWEHAYGGFSTVLSVGNQADVEFHEFLESLGEDPDTGAIVCYVEGFRSGRAFFEAARRVAQVKPVVMYKAGRNATGARMARSHSGSLAGDYAVSHGVLRQAGVTLVARPEHLLPVAEALILLPPLRGRNVAIISEGGGPITVAAEALADRGMHLVELSGAAQQKIRAVIPNSTAIANPVDIAVLHPPTARSYGLCALAILEDPDVDALLFTGWFGAYGLRTGGRVAAEELEMAKRVAARARELGKAVVVQSHYATHRTEALVAMREGGVPFHHDFDSAIECICAAVERGVALRRMEEPGALLRGTPAAPSAGLFDACRAAGRTTLLEPEALDLLDAFGIATPPRILARTPADLGQAIARFGDTPLAMKVVSPDILHKSEAGGVRLGLAGAAALREAMDGIRASARAHDARARVEGVLVSPMAAPGVEVIVGTLHDPQYGPVLVFGLGGVLVEVLRDVVFRALPITAADAREMLAEIRAHAVLDGVRGMPPADRQALVELMLAVSALACACPDITELDLNPVIVHARGCTIVDARVVFAPESPNEESPE